MNKGFFIIIFFFLNVSIQAQTCSIISASTACKEEIMSFDVTASAGISSVSWDMGDGTTSTQQNFSHKYSTPGKKNVTATVNLTGGGTCIATNQITVYELPIFKITKKADNNYCLWQNYVCLVDSSSGGDSGVSISKRIILWDDGNQDVSTNPRMGDVVCHHYSNSGTYKVTIELTNSKNCKSVLEVEITILQDILPKLSVYSIDNENLRFCDSARTEFEDVYNGDTSTIISRIYDWGDGSPQINTTKKSMSHFYHQSGTYRVSLSYIQKNGCVTTKDTVIDVIVYGVKFDITKNAFRQCMGNVFRFQQKDSYSGAWYFWSLDNIVAEWDQDLKFVDLSPDIGRHFIALEIFNHGCHKEFKYDTIEVIGFRANVIALNDNQCENKDTVFFSTKVKQYGTGKLSYFWDFGDDKSPQCTTSRVNGINVDGNCNYSTDSLGKHFYVNGKCRSYTLIVSDSVSGCIAYPIIGGINVIKPDSINFRYVSRRLCIGEKEDYYIDFSHNVCSSVKVSINLDSTCDKDRWSTRFISQYPYTSTCDKDGWVTVGLAIRFGNPIVYKGFSDTSNFYVDLNRECSDTIWKHKWFRLTRDPIATFDPNPNCVNKLTKPIIIDSIQKEIAFTTWNWGDNSRTDTIPMATGDSVIRAKGHVYKRPGTFVIRYYVENKNGCYSEQYKKVVIGFYMHLNFDTVICPGSMVQLKDSMYYLDSSLVFPNVISPSINYWHVAERKKNNKETFVWNFDDGRGWVTDTANPVISFQNIGNYKIQLAAKDSFNCWDTLSTTINVGGVHAGIRNIYKRIICDGIVQLYDSSYSDYKPPLDSITNYYWDFGDGGNPSFVKDPFHYYNTFGNYTIFQKVGNSRGCTDTAYINISVEGPIANFKIESDTVGCAPFTAEFKNTSIKTKDYIWYFGDPLKTKLSTNSDTNVRFTYTKPGTYSIYLFGSDSVKNPNAGNAIYYCKSFFPDTSIIGHPIRKIVVLPAPKADFDVNFIQCKNKPILVTNNSDPLYTTHRWSIRNIDSIETSENSGTLITKDTGTFSIKYKPWYPPQMPYNISCLDSATKLIKVTEIKAAFNLIKDTTSCPVFTFINQTKNYKTITWNMDDSMAGNLKNIRHDNQFTYKYESGKGVFNPCLFAENTDGCQDTLCTTVNVDFIVKLIIPNVFTPGNDDGKNDVYDIVAEGMEEYNLKIYNRWGQKLFETDKDGVGDDGNNWRGRANVVSDLYPNGTYFYIFNYKFKCEEKANEVTGTITLIGGKN
jgi:gliding motility-associated-like protein